MNMTMPSTQAFQSQAYTIQADLQQISDIRRITEIAMAHFGQVDHLINCAADTKFYGNLRESYQADDHAAKQFLTNCISPMWLASAIYDACWKDAPAVNAVNNRSVVNVSSMSGVAAFPPMGQAFYAASKSALNMLSAYLTLELAPYAVRVNGICPGGFTAGPTTDEVVIAIRKLMQGGENGQLITQMN